MAPMPRTPVVENCRYARGPRALGGAGSLLWLVGILLFGAPSPGAEVRDEPHAAKGVEAGRQHLGAGRLGKALNVFESVVRRYPRTLVAAEAQWEIAGMYARNREISKAFDAYQKLVDKFPNSDLHNRAVARQMELVSGIMSAYRRQDTRGERPSDALLPPRIEIKTMLRMILASGAGTETAPEAQFQLGVVLEETGSPKTAKRTHETFIDRYPDHPLADDAAFQIAYIDFKRVREGDLGRIEWAALEMIDFLGRYPDSPKVPEAHHCVRMLGEFEAQHWREMVAYYERQGDARAAAVYRDRLQAKYPAAAAGDQ